jgi:hypothetical protein
MRAGAVCLALVALACGKSKEEQRFEFVRSTCQSFVPGSTTYGQAVAALDGGQLGYVEGPCLGGLVSWGADDACAYATDSVCVVDIQFLANDPGVCSTGPAGGCFYGCAIRMNLPDLQAQANKYDTLICARRFYGPQAAPYVQ